MHAKQHRSQTLSGHWDGYKNTNQATEFKMLDSSLRRLRSKEFRLLHTELKFQICKISNQ